ncbi:hypothetical protein AMS62_22795 [Bacillus sp. FJAT-18019]|nr:hypothetical protein AMS62_22795 [Bacillus sp. FJAT-18019]
MRFKKGATWRSPALSSEALCYVAKGSGQLYINGTSHRMQSGYCCLLHPGTRITAHVGAKHAVVCYIVEYDSHNSDSGSDPLQFKNLVMPVPNPSYWETLLEQMHQLSRTSLLSAVLRRHALFYELLHTVALQGEQQPRRGEDTIGKTIDYLNSHYMNPIEVGSLPRLAGLTPSAYCRAFKKLTGLSPSSYLTRLRLNKAKELLAATDRPTLKEIASSIGYGDELYFSRVFKKTEGISPTGFASRRHTRVAVVSHLFLQDHLLALGIQPVAAPAYPSVYNTPSGFPAYLQHRLDGTLPLNAERYIPLEDVQCASPDLIIKMDFRGNPNDGSWQAAGNTVHFGGCNDWDDYLRELSSLLRTEALAERIIRRVALTEAAQRDKLRHISKSGTWTIVRILPGDIRIYGVTGHAFSDMFYRGLGFQPNGQVSHSFYKRITFEELLQLNPERMLLLWSDSAGIGRLQHHPLWKELRAAQHGQIYQPDSSQWDPWGPVGRSWTLKACAAYFEQQFG